MIWGINPCGAHLHIPSSEYLWPHLCHLGSSWIDPEVGLPVRCDPPKSPEDKNVRRLHVFGTSFRILVTRQAQYSWLRWPRPFTGVCGCEWCQVGSWEGNLWSCWVVSMGFCFKRNPLKPQNPHHFSICLSARDAQRGIAFGSRENGRAHPFVGIGFARGIWGEKPW